MPTTSRPDQWAPLVNALDGCERILLIGAGPSSELIKPRDIKGAGIIGINAAGLNWKCRIHVAADIAAFDLWWDQRDINAVWVTSIVTQRMRPRIQEGRHVCEELLWEGAGNPGYRQDRFYAGSGAEGLWIAWELARRTGLPLVTAGIDLGNVVHRDTGREWRYGRWFRHHATPKQKDGMLPDGPFDGHKCEWRPVNYNRQTKVIASLAEHHRQEGTVRVQSRSLVDWTRLHKPNIPVDEKRHIPRACGIHEAVDWPIVAKLLGWDTTRLPSRDEIMFPLPQTGLTAEERLTITGQQLLAAIKPAARRIVILGTGPSLDLWKVPEVGRPDTIVITINSSYAYVPQLADIQIVSDSIALDLYAPKKKLRKQTVWMGRDSLRQDFSWRPHLRSICTDDVIHRSWAGSGYEALCVAYDLVDQRPGIEMVTVVGFDCGDVWSGGKPWRYAACLRPVHRKAGAKMALGMSLKVPVGPGDELRIPASDMYRKQMRAIAHLLADGPLVRKLNSRGFRDLARMRPAPTESVLRGAFQSLESPLRVAA